MRTIIILIFFFQLGYSQNTLIIDFELCRNAEHTSEFWNDYRLIKNDTIISEHKDSFLKLPDGKYQIEYKTYFGWKKTNAFLLFDNIFFQVNLCIDKLENNSVDVYNLGITSIKDGEKLIITNNYAGCFSEGGEKIIIERNKNSFTLIYNDKKRKLKRREFDYFKEYKIYCRGVDNYKESVRHRFFWKKEKENIENIVKQGKEERKSMEMTTEKYYKAFSL